MGQVVQPHADGLAGLVEARADVGVLAEVVAADGLDDDPDELVDRRQVGHQQHPGVAPDALHVLAQLQPVEHALLRVPVGADALEHGRAVHERVGHDADLGVARARRSRPRSRRSSSSIEAGAVGCGAGAVGAFASFGFSVSISTGSSMAAAVAASGLERGRSIPPHLPAPAADAVGDADPDDAPGRRRRTRRRRAGPRPRSRPDASHRQEDRGAREERDPGRREGDVAARSRDPGLRREDERDRVGIADWKTIAPVMLPIASVSLPWRTQMIELNFSGSSVAIGAITSASSTWLTPSAVATWPTASTNATAPTTISAERDQHLDVDDPEARAGRVGAGVRPASKRWKRSGARSSMSIDGSASKWPLTYQRVDREQQRPATTSFGQVGSAGRNDGGGDRDAVRDRERAHVARRGPSCRPA